MPLKVSIGVSKKVGQPDYGSLGANCQLEAEMDASLAEDPKAFHGRIKALYSLAHQAVSEQLDQNGKAGQSSRGTNGEGNGHQNGRNGGDDNTVASNKQIKFLLDLARQRHRMNLTQTGGVCQELVGINDVYQLSRRQASLVIDHLSSKNGNGNGNGRR